MTDKKKKQKKVIASSSTACFCFICPVEYLIAESWFSQSLTGEKPVCCYCSKAAYRCSTGVTKLQLSKGHAAAVDCPDDDDDNDVSYLSTGVHPYPRQRVECVQALHRVQGAPQPPEVSVSAGGHLQLPTQESHREQGELKITTTCVCDGLLAFLCGYEV